MDGWMDGWMDRSKYVECTEHLKNECSESISHCGAQTEVRIRLAEVVY